MKIREEFDRLLNSGVHGPGTFPASESCMCGGGCESVLECEFWYYLRKTPGGEQRAMRQFPIGSFRVDCLIECDDHLVVVELDGKEFHQDKRADFQRDTELLKSIDAVIRIPYAAMHFYPMATFAVLGSWYPRFAYRFKDIWCIERSELAGEMQKAWPLVGTFDEREWVKQNENRYEIWKASDDGPCGFGYVCSVRACLEHHDVSPIFLRRRTGREFEPHGPVREVRS